MTSHKKEFNHQLVLQANVICGKCGQPFQFDARGLVEAEQFTLPYDPGTYARAVLDFQCPGCGIRGSFEVD